MSEPVRALPKILKPLLTSRGEKDGGIFKSPGVDDRF